MEEIKKEVLKKAFAIFPLEDADNLKHIRKSVIKIIEDKCASVSDFEKVIELTIKEFLGIINEIKDPYPLDLFHGLENEDVASVVDLIKKHSKISPDRVSAHLMRKARENLKEEIIERLTSNNRNKNKGVEK